MKIADITIDIYTMERARLTPRPDRYFTPEPHTCGLVRVLTDQGIEGHASLITDARMGKGAGKHMTYGVAAQILGLLKKELVGRDIADREWLWDQLYLYQWWGRIDQRAWSVLDRALWDAAGKAVSLPVYKLLGAARERIAAYDNCPHMRDIEPQVERAVEARKRGYRGFKLHPGTLPVERILELTTRVRQAVGDEMDLMDDEALTLDFESALRIGRHLEELNYRWFEDPLRHTDYHGYAELCRRLSIPVAWTDHHLADFEQTADMARRTQGLRIIRGDSMRFGITGLKKLCSLTEGLGLKCEIHSGNTANLHVALSVSNCTYFENTTVWPMGEPIPADHQFALDADGCVRAPTTPGTGEFIDPDRIKATRIETIS